jgi:hypothetical protein
MSFSSLSALAALALLAPAQEYAPYQDGPQRGAPRGSYAQTCTGSYVNQGRLYADCQDTRGRVRSTSIELARCSSSDIANDNGLLVCSGVRGSYENNGNGGGWGGGNNGGGWGGGNNGGGWGGGGWGGNGGGRNAITVYVDADFRGSSDTLRGEIRDLARTGFNDRISSMQMNGSWEACTDANFRGQCRVFTGSVRNLAYTGMNDRISSLRPVRGGGRW